MLIISLSFFIFVVYADEGVVARGNPAESSSYLVNIISDTDSVEIGDEIHLSGKIDRSLLFGGRSDTIILISAPEGSLADTFVLSSPDITGSFDYHLPADVGGIWGFEALYTGIYSQKLQVEAIPSDELHKTTLTLTGWPVYPQVGERVSFKGRLSDASGKGISNCQVNYELTRSQDGCLTDCMSPHTEWASAGYESTDLSGEFRFTLPIEDEGWVLVRTVFSGDQQYSGSISREIAINAKNSQ